MLPLAKQSLDKAIYELSRAVVKLAGITFSRLAFSYWIDNLGFITEGKLAAIFMKPSLGVSNWPVIYFINYTPTSFLEPSSPRHQEQKLQGLPETRAGPPTNCTQQQASGIHHPPPRCHGQPGGKNTPEARQHAVGRA
jgi:hypothetical protein